MIELTTNTTKSLICCMPLYLQIEGECVEFHKQKTTLGHYTLMFCPLSQ